MFHSIRFKLISSYLAIALVTASLIFSLIHLTSGRQLKILRQEEQVEDMRSQMVTFYEETDSVQGFPQFFARNRPSPPPSNPNQGRQPPTERPPRGPEGNNRPASPPTPSHNAPAGMLTADYIFMAPYHEFSRGDVASAEVKESAVPVIVDGETVGWIVPARLEMINFAYLDEVYLRNTNRILLISGGIGILVAVLMGAVLSNVLLYPIHEMTEASVKMAAGDFSKSVAVESSDELGQLAMAFNQMSADLNEANQRRREMTAEIAHDLGTPLQVISGYVESVQDGSLNMTPKRLNTIASEIGHLRRLVEDLDLLAQTDTHTLYLRTESVNPAEFIDQVGASFTPLMEEKGINLTIDRPDQLPEVDADPQRLAQVMGNLINNAMRYTPVGGSIKIRGRQFRQGLLLQVVDTGAGIEANQLSSIFDRFYRGDPSRTGNAGKMGLGLAICKALIEEMGGKIWAESMGKDAGASLSIYLPFSPSSSWIEPELQASTDRGPLAQLLKKNTTRGMQESPLKAG